MAPPEVLDHLMDETLNQLERLVRVRPTTRWFVLHKTHLDPLYTLCPCGLNPLLSYFSAGGEALQGILADIGGLSGPGKDKISQGWHFIAQSEIQALCGLCHNICAPALSFPMILGSGFNSQGGRTGPTRARKPVAC